MRLILIGLAAGFFSALFGVGGGTVIVPLLLLVGVSTEVERDGEALQLDFLLRPRRVGRERGEYASPAIGLWLELEPVRADADDAVYAQSSADVLARAPADDCHERVPADQPPELSARLGRRHRVLRPLDDRRENAVEVEEEPSRDGIGRELLDECVGPAGHGS